jgi:hypothetical protein
VQDFLFLKEDFLAFAFGSRRIATVNIYRVLLFVVLAFGVSAPAVAQSGLQSGIVGRVKIDPYVQNTKTWQVNSKKLLQQRTHARIRRNSGHGPVRPTFEAAPLCQVVLQGARSTEKMPINTIHFVGKTIEPSQLLMVQNVRVRLTNDEISSITPIEIAKDGTTIEHTKLLPGKSTIIELADNSKAITSLEHSYAKTELRMLQKSRVLEIREGGIVNRIFLESGDYELIFFHGVRQLFSQPLVVPENGFVAFDATVSRNLEVKVTLKDGALQVARNPVESRGSVVKPPPPVPESPAPGQVPKPPNGQPAQPAPGATDTSEGAP